MDGMDWMASAMRAARAQLDVATHNLANASTDGFRHTAAAVALTARGLAVAERATHEQGAVHRTGRTFDLALLGPGSFRVVDAAAGRRASPGATAHDTAHGAARPLVTRDGVFQRDKDGWIVDDRGRRLLGACGPLRVSERATVASDGAIHDGGRIVDRLPLPVGTHVLAGALETSTVNPIGETLSILTAQRAFETAQKTMLAIDATREKSANDVVRVQ